MIGRSVLFWKVAVAIRLRVPYCSVARKSFNCIVNVETSVQWLRPAQASAASAGAAASPSARTIDAIIPGFIMLPS
ncbi:MAG: hypothetical protein AMXMBFR37_17780 [Steroidobacteraceae bacterium]